MRALLVTTLFALGCASPDAAPDFSALEYWESSADDWAVLWDVLDARFGVGDSDCINAYDNVSFVEAPQSELDKIMCGEQACTVATFSDDVPLGSYTVVFDENLADQWRCLALTEELIHIADECLANNDPSWPFAGIDHAPELYDAMGEVYAVELEVRAMTYDDCRAGK